MKRFVVYYLYDDNTPRYLLARRGETPDDTIDRALERFDGTHLDPKKARFLLVTVGDDQGYGKMIDVTMSTIVFFPRTWNLVDQVIV